jgi:hypothetical protein
MKLIRACFLVLAVLLPTSWTLAHAGDEAGSGGEMKKGKGKKSKKKEGGDMGGDKKGDMDKK